MNKIWKNFLTIVFLVVAVWGIATRKARAAPASIKQEQISQPNPADLIIAVNNLRLANGLPALNTHPVLMQVAQWEADAILNGAPGHTRPPGLTLGQWMILLGYPLGGNIALDGYRSENWVAGSEMTVGQAIESWLGDAPHTNTMLSPNRSDIGAGVAVGEDQQGKPVYYYVIETALQTRSGQQQPEALALLTSLPQTQSVGYTDGTQAAAALLVPQYIIPVSVATAHPDGDVIHEVKYGQALWSIAIAYGVKIYEIKLLNNLASDEVWPNQLLLVQKGATQPALSPTEVATRTTPIPSVHPTQTKTATMTPQPETEDNKSTSSINPTLILFLVVIVFVVGLVTWLVVQDIKRA
ncbi:MAG: LysM peptidoglycan-binding domain-containing protein [Anaerolineales bacterium]|nr:LysM peptidoglycan-binding domain-containing protein [Anaerolineales bacterium]